MDDPSNNPPDGIDLWIDQDVIMIKALDECKDPIELNAHESQQLIEALSKCIQQIEKE